MKASENSRSVAVVLTVERGVVRLVGIPDPRNGGRDEACRVNRTDLAGAQRVRTHLTIGIAEVTKRVGSILRTWCHTPAKFRRACDEEKRREGGRTSSASSW